ncbi:MAG: FAD-dependent oxidoreductase [Firmicutes bacterium]|nr:FAD-dependent oxidoreductase [Bacillota bacterium]
MVYDVIIIGGGTAGLSAALYTLRGGLSTLLLEAEVHGGQIIVSPEVENYPALPKISGAEYAQQLLEQVESIGLQIKYEAAEAIEPQAEIKTVRTAYAEYQARTLIWAVGVSPRRLNCPGEEKFLGRGVSFCATCDGALYKGKEVAVIGGGNTALEEALFLAGICSRVHLIHRRESFRAEAALQQRVAAEEKIVSYMSAEVAEFVGDKRVRELRLQTPDGEQLLAVDGAFLAVGRLPANEILRPYVLLDDAGYVQAGEDCRTETPGFFVAGDCRTKPLRQLVTAAADGAVAATAAIAYLRGA